MLRFYKEIKDILNKHSWIAPIFIFLITLAYSLWFWPGLTFPDGDSFYHIKMTELLGGGIVRDFPWLPFTTLADHYMDHHFLYHVFLIPFIYFFGPFLGMKIATHFFVSLAMMIFYLVIRVFKFFAPGFFTLLLLTAPTFMLRMSLAKTPPFSLVFVLLGLYFIVKNKNLALGILSFLYVWAYGGWPLLPFIATIWILARSFIEAVLDDGGIKRFFVNLRSKEYIKLITSVIAGSLLGLIINPYFPDNIFVNWIQFVLIAVFNYQSKINVGAEWYGTGFLQLLGSHALIFFALAVAIIFMIMEAARFSSLRLYPSKEELVRIFGFMALAAVFFVITIKSRRNIEYLMPFLVIGIASLFTLVRKSVASFMRLVAEKISSRIFLIYIILCALNIASIGVLSADSVAAHRRVLIDGHKPEYLSRASDWIKTNASEGSMIFHSDWDNFPMLFYHNDSARYISGLDPTFFYIKDKSKYELWRKIVWNEYAGDPAQVIKEEFNSRYVFITRGRGHDFFELQMSLSPGALTVYEDDEGVIFSL